MLGRFGRSFVRLPKNQKTPKHGKWLVCASGLQDKRVLLGFFEAGKEVV